MSAWAQAGTKVWTQTGGIKVDNSEMIATVNRVYRNVRMRYPAHGNGEGIAYEAAKEYARDLVRKRYGVSTLTPAMSGEAIGILIGATAAG